MKAQSGESEGAPTDAYLVERVRLGDQTVFAQLVGQYTPMVLALAERILGDSDEALDVAQEAFLQVHRQLGQLKQASRLRSWLWKIARNRALWARRCRSGQPSTNCLGEAAVMSGLTARQFTDRSIGPADYAELSELRTLVRERIGVLAPEYRRLIRLHYLDQVSMAEIARQLNIPVGTAKWRLALARRELRKELTMPGHRDAVATPEVLPQLDVSITWGSNGGPVGLCRTLLAQHILYLVRKQPKTAGQLATQLSVDARYVQDHLDSLTAAEVLTRRSRGFRANFLLFDQDDINRLRRRFSGRGSAIARVVKEFQVDLDLALGRTSPARQGFGVGYLRWLVLPVMVLNFGMAVALGKARNCGVEPPPRPDGGFWFFKPRLKRSTAPVELGCNSYEGHAGGAAQFWTSLTKIRITRPSRSEIAVLQRLAAGPVPVGQFAGQITESGLATMKERGMVRLERGQARLAAPVFSVEDRATLAPVVEAVANSIVEQVLDEFPEDVYATFDELGFRFIRQDWPAHAVDWSVHGSLQALIEAAVLPPLPKAAPPGWGFFLWQDGFF